MGRFRGKFMDPEGATYGIPTYPWKLAPDHLLTLRQLRKRGLRPGGQEVQAQIAWPSNRPGSRDGVAYAYLYDVRLAKPKRTATPAQLAAIGKALTARCTCPDCGVVQTYYIPRRFGACYECDGWKS